MWRLKARDSSLRQKQVPGLTWMKKVGGAA